MLAIALLVLVLPVDAAFGGHAADILVVCASLFCALDAIVFTKIDALFPPTEVALHKVSATRHLGNPRAAVLEAAGVVLAAVLASPTIGILLTAAALLNFGLRQKILSLRCT